MRYHSHHSRPQTPPGTLGLRLGVSLLLTVLTLVCCLIGPIITSYIPLSYADDDMSAPVSGILDAMVYLGGSVSTYLLGHLVGNGVLTGAAWYWMVVALLGTVASTAALRLVKPRHEAMT